MPFPSFYRNPITWEIDVALVFSTRRSLFPRLVIYSELPRSLARFFSYPSDPIRTPPRPPDLEPGLFFTRPRLSGRARSTLLSLCEISRENRSLRSSRPGGPLPMESLGEALPPAALFGRAPRSPSAVTFLSLLLLSSLGLRRLAGSNPSQTPFFFWARAVLREATPPRL